MKDNRTLEQKYRDMKLQEVSDLYYGSDKARDTYAKDTPGQTPGVDHNPDFQRHDAQLAIDGVPEKGGMIKKPVVSKAIKKDATPVKFKSVIAEIADAIDENMSPEQRKKAAAKIFQMHQDKKASQALSQPKSKAAKAAKRDAASYKTSDDSHLDSKPKAPEKKRGRGEKDLPHIVSQLRGVVDTGKGVPSKVKFKDGTTRSVKPKHAASWLKKHDAAKPAEKLKMYDSHKDKATFKQYAKEDYVVEAHLVEGEGPNCGCGKEPCETYGKDPLMPKGKNKDKMNEAKVKCEHCNGTGKHEGEDCTECKGTGFLEEQFNAYEVFIDMQDEEFDDIIETLTLEALYDLEEGIGSALATGAKAVAKGVGAVAKGVYKGGKFVATKTADRLSTKGRADAAEKKLKRLTQKRKDRERLQKAKQGLKDLKMKDKPINFSFRKEEVNEAARRAYDRSSKGRAYRRLSDEEKQRLQKKNELMRAARRMRGQQDDDYESRGRMRKPTIGAAKSVYRGKKVAREQMEYIINSLEEKYLGEEDKMPGVEYYPRMKKHGKMSDAQRKAVTSVYDKKPFDKKMAKDPQVKRAQRYMKVEQAVSEALKGFGDSSMTGMDPNDATKQSELDKDRKMRNKMMKHDMKKGRDVSKVNYSSVEQRKRAQKKFGESIDKVKPAEWDKANREYKKNKPKTHQSYQKGGKNDPRGMGSVLAMGEQKVNELYPSQNTGTIDMNKNRTAKQKKAAADHAKKRDSFEKKYPGASTGEKMFAKLSSDRKNPKISFKSPYRPLGVGKKGIKHSKPATNSYESVQVNELSADLINRVRQKRVGNVVRAYNKYDDYRSPEYKDAMKKADRNQKLTFRAGAKKADQFAKALSKSINKKKTNEENIDELSRRTLTNYIQKAANPVGKKSAITYASKGAYKLGKSDKYDLDAGEKDDRKAFKRGKGIMRAAQKIQRKTYGNMTKPTPYGGSEMSKSLTRKTKSESVSLPDSDVKKLSKIVKGLRKSVKGHDKQQKYLQGLLDKDSTNEEIVLEKSLPNNPKLWAAKKAQAKAKFDVYPSAYANGWAAKQYKKAGGTWRSAK